MALGPFFLFAETGEFASTGLLRPGMMSLTMICSGAIVAVFGVLSLVLRRRYVHWYLGCSTVTGATTFYYHLVIGAQGWSTLSLGIQFCYLGALLSFLAGGVSLARRPTQPLKARLAGVTAILSQPFSRDSG